MSILGPSHVGICVGDLERSIHFYCALLGFRLVSRIRVRDDEVARLLELSGIDMELVFVEWKGVRLELISFDRPRPEPRDSHDFNRLGFTHLSVCVDKFDETLRTLEAAGVTVLKHTIARSEASNARFAFCLDPDGTRVELFGTIDDAGPKPWDIG